MDGEVLEAIGTGAVTERQLGRSLKMSRDELREALVRLVASGRVREMHPACPDKGCRGCRHHGRCDTMPVTGYALAEDS